MVEAARWQWWRVWRRWGAATLVAATASFAIDNARIALAASSARGLGAMQQLTLWSGHALLGLLVLALVGAGGLTRSGVARLRRDADVHATSSRGRLGRWLQLVLPSVVVFFAVAWPLVWVGRELASGAWISEQSFAPLVAYAPVAAGLFAAPIAVALAASPDPASRRQRWITWALAASVVALAVVDHRVAPGLYAPFHMVVHVLLVATTMIAGARWFCAGRVRLGVAVDVALLAMVVAAPLVWATMSSVTRSALVLRSAVARDWIRHAMPEQPPRLLHDMLAVLDVGAGEYAPSAEAEPPVPFAGRGDLSVVLVVVDTLRADALPPARPEGGTAFVQPGDMPRVDAWMNDAFRFRYAYSTSTKTHRAMPTMFRSIRAGDDPRNAGVPLGLRMEELGLRPGAAVNTFFIADKYPQIVALLDGFGEDLSVYEKVEEDTAIPGALDLIRSFGKQQFFVWIHLYNVHDPGYDGAMMNGRDGSRPERYRKSLRYLDGQFGALLDGLAELGVDGRTAVVLTSDHGEGLGDHGQMLHGPNVFEEDIGVPLAFAVPGQTGRLIEETVGTIDLAPTLVDLLGAPPNPGDRGRSLVPLFVGESHQPTRPYFFEAADNATVGVIVGRDKLIYEGDIDVTHRFDVGTDPDEHEDLFEPGGSVDDALLRTLVEYRPKIVAAELEDPTVLALLGARLAEVDPAQPGAALPLLVQLVALAPRPELVRRCAAIFDDGGRDVRLLVARHLLGRAPKTMTPRVVRWLEEHAGTPAELEIVTALSRQGQGAFSTATVAARTGHYANSGTADTWEPWLRLVTPWRKPAAEFLGPFTVMLARAQDDPAIAVPPSILELVLENAAALDFGGGKASKRRPPKAGTKHAEAQGELLRFARALMAHPDPRIRTAAVRVLGQFDDEASVDLARARMLDHDEDLRVRRESAATFTRLAHEAGIDDLVELGKDIEMSTFAVRNMKAIGTRKVVPYLRKVEKEHYNGYLRREAGRAADAIEKVGAKAKGAGRRGGA